MILIILFITVCFLAYSNGANDNFKGVATLFGSRTLNFKRAINWATITTLLGSAAALFFAETLIKNFSGKGLVPDELVQSPIFAISVAAGAAITVFIATKIGMPVSTTHGIVGALLGCGVVAIGSNFNFAKLADTFLLPLVVSPLIAAILSLIMYRVFRKSRIALGVKKEMCVCINNEMKPISEINFNGTLTLDKANVQSLTIAPDQECVEVYQNKIFGFNAQNLLDFFHYISAGTVSFARGLNDSPKILGLVLVINALDLRLGLFFIAGFMAVGGLLNSKKVGETMSLKITSMNHGQGFTANLITALLVTTASYHGLPVSTTHVSVGSIFGIGTVTGDSNYKVVKNILLSWVMTLPTAAVCGAVIYWLLSLSNLF